MKTLLCILIFTLPFFGNVYAQLFPISNYEIKQALDFYNYNKFDLEKFNKVNSEPEVSGSPFLNDDFIKGSLFTTSKIKYESIPLRYNIYYDQVEFKNNEGQAYAIGVPEILEKVEFDGYTIEFIQYFDANQISRGLFTVLEKGSVTLYSKQKVVYEPATPLAPFKEPQPARFERKPDEYFIRKGMEPAKKILNKKNLVELFADKEEKLNAFIKKNRVKTNRPESLIKLVKYYNSL